VKTQVAPTNPMRESLEPRSIENFPNTMAAMLEEHRPSRMPFFGRLAALPGTVVGDPSFLGQIHLIYQSAMHATRAAVYYLPHLDSPALRKRKLQIFIDDDGLPGRRHSSLPANQGLSQHWREMPARRGRVRGTRGALSLSGS